LAWWKTQDIEGQKDGSKEATGKQELMTYITHQRLDFEFSFQNAKFQLFPLDFAEI
jgi:hypothetical protein